MADFVIKEKDTVNKDILMATPEGFPALYMGRGSYCGYIDDKSYAFIRDGHNEVHLLYVGRYTSIGCNVRIYHNLNHDYRSLYMGSILDFGEETPDNDYRTKVGQMMSRIPEKGTVLIGNDVWIGDNVTILSDTTIGNGAVIGADSVVTGNIPPYTIWAGNPARQIGQRFDDDTIAALQRISWWELSREQIAGMKADMQGEVSDFVARYDRDIGVNSNRNSNVIRFLAFLDISTDYCTFGNVVEQFVRKFGNDDSQELIVAFHKENENEVTTAKALVETIEEMQVESKIRIKEISICDDEAIIADSDYMVVGRDGEYILRLSYASKYGVGLISGVSPNMFVRF